MTTTMATWVLFLRGEMNKVMKCDSSRPLFSVSVHRHSSLVNLASRRPHRQLLVCQSFDCNVQGCFHRRNVVLRPA
jgi:hypothetical protein